MGMDKCDGNRQMWLQFAPADRSSLIFDIWEKKMGKVQIHDCLGGYSFKPTIYLIF